MGELTHFNEQGRARMVDVSPETMTYIKNGTLKKGTCWRCPWRP